MTTKLSITETIEKSLLMVHQPDGSQATGFLVNVLIPRAKE